MMMKILICLGVIRFFGLSGVVKVKKRGIHFYHPENLHQMIFCHINNKVGWPSEYTACVFSLHLSQLCHPERYQNAAEDKNF